MSVQRSAVLKPQSKILALSPHTDDAELGAGGTIARWIAAGHDVHYVAFSACEESVPAGFAPDVLRAESNEATTRLGIPKNQARILNFKVRLFGEARQEVLQSMVDLNLELKPDIVLLPSLGDIHQDHSTIAIEGLRAFKRTALLAYDLPWNNPAFAATAFVSLDQEDIDAKIDALAAYESQAHRTYASAQFQQAQAIFRGQQIGTQYAEAFEVLRIRI